MKVTTHGIRDKELRMESGMGTAGHRSFGCMRSGKWRTGMGGLPLADAMPHKLGQMGDFFGGMLNPLVSALTLFVTISVWQLQKKELKATQKALKEQAKTSKSSRDRSSGFDLLLIERWRCCSRKERKVVLSVSGKRSVTYC